uniref:Uncharacterized protein n=1 Tax=Glossina palpalis gambiensis TaxID=67801 RepID=A0A1B0AW96_9MUSC
PYPRRIGNIDPKYQCAFAISSVLTVVGIEKLSIGEAIVYESRNEERSTSIFKEFEYHCQPQMNYVYVVTEKKTILCQHF